MATILTIDYVVISMEENLINGSIFTDYKTAADAIWIADAVGGHAYERTVNSEGDWKLEPI